MSEVDKRILGIENDIKSIKVQGATNVALAVLNGIELYVESYKGDSVIDFYKGLKKVGFLLAYARTNEPLATNAIKFILAGNWKKSRKGYKGEVINTIEQYRDIIANAKREMVQNGIEELKSSEGIFTHCHSSSAVEIILGVAKKVPNMRVFATETRPLYQGRKTAKELFDKKIDVTLVVDSASASVIADDRYFQIGTVIVGCDELLPDGKFLNKVGTYQIALSAKHGGDRLYVATPLLKIDFESEIDYTKVEMRKSSEIWEDAPKGLKIYNPAFEVVPSTLVEGYITEAGVLKANEIEEKAKEMYPWVSR